MLREVERGLGRLREVNFAYSKDKPIKIIYTQAIKQNSMMPKI
jgi:hypothetical protein